MFYNYDHLNEIVHITANTVVFSEFDTTSRETGETPLLSNHWERYLSKLESTVGNTDPVSTSFLEFWNHNNNNTLFIIRIIQVHLLLRWNKILLYILRIVYCLIKVQNIKHIKMFAYRVTIRALLSFPKGIQLWNNNPFPIHLNCARFCHSGNQLGFISVSWGACVGVIAAIDRALFWFSKSRCLHPLGGSSVTFSSIVVFTSCAVALEGSVTLETDSVVFRFNTSADVLLESLVFVIDSRAKAKLVEFPKEHHI